jgi:hypothetical protein
MKAQLALASLLLLPALALAEGTPDGVLETSNISVYGAYDHTAYKGYYSTDYAGGGISWQQKVYSDEKFGVNVGFDYEYWTDCSSWEYDKYTGNSYMPFVTVYAKQSWFTPFAGLRLDITDATYYGDESETSTWFAPVLGAEFYMMPGWYVTPSVAIWTRIHSNDKDGDSCCADFIIESGYWITDRISCFGSATFENTSYAREFYYKAGLRLAY